MDLLQRYLRPLIRIAILAANCFRNLRRLDEVCSVLLEIRNFLNARYVIQSLLLQRELKSLLAERMLQNGVDHSTIFLRRFDIKGSVSLLCGHQGVELFAKIQRLRRYNITLCSFELRGPRIVRGLLIHDLQICVLDLSHLGWLGHL